jgi:hypothetical protein
MDRTDSLDNVSRRFSDGNPQAGQGATVLSAKWLNGVQEEILKVIESANLVPSDANLGQLYQAIVMTVAGAVGTGGANVPTTRQITGGGLVSGGGNLAGDRTLTVIKASSAEIVAGLRDDAAITPAGLSAATSGALTNNGYYRFPGGLIMQWGQVRGSYSEGSVFVTLPISFPNAFFSLSLTEMNPSASRFDNAWAQVVSRSLSNFTAYFQNSTDGVVSAGLDFIAIGF